MLIRFQMAKGSFAEMLRGSFQRQNLCIGGLTSTIIVDRIEIKTVGSPPFEAGPAKVIALRDANGGITNVSCNSLRLVQPVMVYFTTMADLQAANGGPPATNSGPLSLKFTLDFERTFNFTSRKWEDLLTVTYDSLGPVLDPSIDAHQIDAALRAQLQPVSTPIDVTGALTSLGTLPETVWVGIAASDDFERVELRLEMHVGGTTGTSDSAGWQQFYQQQNLDDLVHNNDWAMFLDKDMVTGGALSIVKDSIMSAAGFTLKTGPNAIWNAGGPGITITFNGDALDACTCLFGKIDVNVDVTINITLKVQDHQLIQDLLLSHSSNQLQLFCCEISAAFFWPIIGGEMLDGGSITVVEFLAGMAFGPLAIFLTSVIVAGGKPTPFTPPATCSKDPTHEDHVTCTMALPLNDPPNKCTPRDATRLLETVYGLDSGLVLAGSYVDAHLQPPIISVALQQFIWNGPHITCSGFTGNGFNAQASVDVTRLSGDLDFWFCNAEAVGPNADSFNPYISTTFDYCPVRATVHVTVPQYIPGACSLLITTSGGVRFVTLDPMPQLTQQMMDDYVKKAERWRIETCFTKVDDWYEYFHRFNVKWAVDPYQGDKEILHLWIIVAGQLSPGDIVRVMDQHGEARVIGFASTAGTLEISMLNETHDLTLVREPATGAKNAAGSNRTVPMMEVKQVLLVEETSFQTGAPVLAIQGEWIGETARISLVTENGLEVWVIDGQGQVAFKGQVRRAGLVGATAIRGEFLVWRADGRMDILSSVSAMTNIQIPGLVAVANPGVNDEDAFLNALTVRHLPSDLVAWSKPQWMEMGPIALIGDQVVVGQGETVRILDTSVSEIARRQGHLVRDLHRLASVPLHRNQVLAMTSSDEGWVLNVSKDGNFVPVAHYRERPWFDRSCQMGALFVRLDNDHQTLRVYRIGASRTL